MWNLYTSKAIISLGVFVLACFSITGCSDFRDRLDGYPTEDISINMETASSNELADELNRISRMSVIGDDWELEDEADKCTITVIEGDTDKKRIFSLRDAVFDIHTDQASDKHYATIKNRDDQVLDDHGHALRLFETNSYQSLYIAEGYLIALAQKCANSLLQSS